MINITQTIMSCGVKQIDGIQTFNVPGGMTPTAFRNKLKEYIKGEMTRRSRLGDGGGAKSNLSKIGFVFSDQSSRDTPNTTRGGAGAAAYLEREGLGKVTFTGGFKNYNTGNRIGIWAFVPNRDFMDEACDRPKRLMRRIGAA